MALLTAQRRRLHRPLDAVALTVSGNEMADTFGVSRKAGAAGDGKTFPDRSVGVWPAATNLCINGNATTNTTGVTDNSSTTTRATTGTVKFGSTCFNVVSSNLAANEGPSQAVNGGVGSTLYTVSVWAWLVSGAATVRAVLSDSVAGKQGSAGVVLTTTPVRISVTATTGALGASVASYIETTVQAVGTWRIGGWQVETTNIATPYIETDGATATRSAGRIRFPDVLGMDETAMFLACRFRYNYSGAQTTPRFHVILSWTDNANEQVELIQDLTNGTWRCTRYTAGAGAEATVAVGTWANGDEVTIVARWSATQVAVSINGGAFTAVGNTNIPTLTSTTPDIGANNETPGRELCGEIRFLAIGRGRDADVVDAAFASQMHTIGVGGGVPDPYDLPGASIMVFDGRNAVAVRRVT